MRRLGLGSCRFGAHGLWKVTAARAVVYADCGGRNHNLRLGLGMPSFPSFLREAVGLRETWKSEVRAGYMSRNPSVYRDLVETPFDSCT